MNEYDKIQKKLDEMTDQNLQQIWDSLKNYDMQSYYAPGVPMDDWAQAIYSEMDKRGMPHIHSRTPEQIENLRKVLLHSVGPYALFMTTEDIGDYADRLQRGVDDIKRTWIVKVRFLGEENKPWKDIHPETVNPYMSLTAARIAYKRIVDVKEQIAAIQICADDEYKDDIHIFLKGKAK